MSPASLVALARQYLVSRKGAYRDTFAGPRGEAVLADLAKFCRANESTFHPDPHVAARLDGRREVWLRIAAHLNLSEDQLLQLYPPNARGNA